MLKELGINEQDLINAFCDLMDDVRNLDHWPDESSEKAYNLFNDLKPEWQYSDGTYVFKR